MKKSNMTRITSTLALTTMVAALAGCASGNYKKGGDAAAGLTDSANRIEMAKGKIDTTVTALNGLVSGSQPDLIPQFKQFTAAVSDLESSAKDVKGKVESMRSAGNEYFKAWDEQLATIQNEDIKNRSAARKTEVQQRFTNIKGIYIEAGDAFKPFMANLKDIQTALSTDLTPGGVAAIKGAADKATKDAVPLKAAVDKLAAEFKALGVAMSSGTAAPTAAPAAK
jgi:hypothetical protein